MVRILLVGEQEAIQPALRVITTASNLTLIGQIYQKKEIVAAVINQQPDLVLIDLELLGKNGLELLEEIRRQTPGLNILALIITTNQNQFYRLIKIGVLGFVLKTCDGDTLYKAMMTVARGEAYIQPCLLSGLLQEFRQLNIPEKESIAPEELGLTQRELEIVRLIARGKSNKDIAENLFISEKTVKNHVSSILRKMALEDRTQVAVFAYEKGLTSSQ